MDTIRHIAIKGNGQGSFRKDPLIETMNTFYIKRFKLT